MRIPSLILLISIVVMSCTEAPKNVKLQWNESLTLPTPISNNAVVSVNADDSFKMFSFLGIKSGKTFTDVTSEVMEFNSETSSWTVVPVLPDNIGRLASSAERVGDYIYIFGGFTVSENGKEDSTPEVYRFDPKTYEYKKMQEMLIAVDDAVSLVYQNRYVYLVSGWHDTDNIPNVQVYDTETNTWDHATPYPGPPVFGHSGGMVGNTMVLADGVKVIKDEDGKIFDMSAGSITGEIDPNDPSVINWIRIPQHPGEARYRMASVGISNPVEMVLFMGGSENPHNFDGMGYNNELSEPNPGVFAWRLDTQEWIDLGNQPEPTMDHRGIVRGGSNYYLLGGMESGQKVTDLIQSFSVVIDEEN